MYVPIPTIDLTGLAEGDRSALTRVANALKGPCEALGVFYVTGHGIPRDEFAAFDAAMRSLFELPESVKETFRRSRDNAWGYYDRELTKNRPDWKRVFDYGAERGPNDPAGEHSDGRNRWPESRSDLKPLLLRHYASCERVALNLIRALSASLGFAPERLDPAFADHSSFVRLNHYPVCTDPAAPESELFPQAGQLGVHHHSDAGGLTLLYQDEVPGLQVQTPNGFGLVEPLTGALLVNLGDMLQVWSNDEYRSPVHRVLASAERERYSAPFFLNPSYAAICEPLIATRQKFRPIPWAHFRDQRSAGDYADYGAEIQIEDYRIVASG